MMTDEYNHQEAGKQMQMATHQKIWGHTDKGHVFQKIQEAAPQKCRKQNPFKDFRKNEIIAIGQSVPNWKRWVYTV